MAVSSLTKYFTEGAIEGFTEIIAPINAFSYAVSPTAATLNDVVRVPYATNGTASSDFAYSTGYSNANAQDVVGKAITLSGLKYQPISLTDQDFQVLTPEVITRLGRQAGARLASDVISASLASVLTEANFSNSSSLGYGSAFYAGGGSGSMVAFADLNKQADTLKWPAERTLIAGTTLWNTMLQNSTMVQAYSFGSADVIQKGQINAVYGFNAFKVSATLPNSDTGFACNPSAIVFANGYHQPGPEASSLLIEAAEMVSPIGGLRIGYRSWYDPAYARTRRVLDCLYGVAVGNSNGLVHIK